MIATFIGATQVKLGSLSSFRGRTSANALPAYYAANSGIEDAILQVQKDPTLGILVPHTYILTVGDIDVEVNVTGNEEEKTIKCSFKNKLEFSLKKLYFISYK